jgi:coenzyme PQQ synthesis protein D (PqqD)
MLESELAPGITSRPWRVTMQISGVVLLVLQPDGKGILEVAGRPIFALNPVAATIWENLAAGLTIHEITGQVVARFNVPEERAADDVENFIELLKKQFLVVDDAQSTTASNHIS